MQDGILSIQSAVAYGHVGNSAAVFPLQRLGFEVWPVNTVLFSNHTGYGAWRGRLVALDWVEEIIEGIAERGAIPHVRAVLSGYLGDPSLGEAGQLGILADSAEASWVCWTPRLPVTLNGTGDAFTALFLGNWLATGRLDLTLERAVAAMYALVDATHRAGSRELELVAAQDQLVAPARCFTAQRLR